MNTRSFTNQRSNDLVLVNFNIPRPIKNRFQSILKQRNISQTSFLNQVIYQFVEENQI